MTLPALAALLLAAASAAPSPACDEPVLEWRPREELKAKLEAAGWQVVSIRMRDGCYDATVRKDDGRQIETFFDPKTLDPKTLGALGDAR